MQEIHYDGSEQITPQMSPRDLERALKDKRNKTVLVHNVGSIITTSDGKQYQVWKDGSLRRVRPESEGA